MSWMTECYSRLLIDTHITDDAPEFMTRFAPAEYVRMVKLAGIDSAMVYACCHNGNCHYPTKVGHMHANLKGRDIFGETVGLLRKEGIAPIAYYTSIYHNQSAKTHPDWRITLADGSQHSGRYWWSCPNNDEYTAFVLAQITEIAAYDIDGLFNDMAFWPGICVCHSCRSKFLAKTGLEIPTRIDWRNRDWMAFQRFREESLATFTQKITASAKAARDITVTHNQSTIMHGWRHASSQGIAKACDYGSGDFYGGKSQQILGAKALAATSANMPYEFMTSRCVNLLDHTSMKSEAELTAEAATTLANGGAYFFIDAINPDGTLEEDVYKRLGSVSSKLKPFADALKRHVPEIHAGKALYYSPASYVGDKTEGNIMSPLPPEMSAVKELTGTATLLTQAHIPFRIVHAQSESFDGLDTIILNGIRYMDKEECRRIREFVANGGTLIATGDSSLCEPDGSSSGEFALADVFGVSNTGGQAASFHYLSFVDRHWLISSHASAPLVKATTAEVLAKIVEPSFDPAGELYASIHSNPPGRETEFAGVTVNRYGKGRCVYISSPVLALKQDAQQEFGRQIFKQFSPSSIITETNAPKCVEISVLKSSRENAFLVSFVNYQQELPNVPVHNVYANMKLLDSAPKSCIRVSDGKSVAAKFEDGTLRLEVPVLETIEMFEIRF